MKNSYSSGWDDQENTNYNSGFNGDEDFLSDFGSNTNFGSEDNFSQHSEPQEAPQAYTASDSIWDDFDSGTSDSSCQSRSSWGYQPKRKCRTKIIPLVGVFLAVCIGIGLFLNGRNVNDAQTVLPTASSLQTPITAPGVTDPDIPPATTEEPQKTPYPTVSTEPVNTEPFIATEPVTAPPLIQDQSIYYARSLLPAYEQQLYDELYESLYRMESSKCLKIKDSTAIEDIFRYIVADHPELFWYINWSASIIDNNDGTHNYDFTFKYNCTREERDQTQLIIDTYAADCLTGLESLDQYHQVKAVYEYIIHHTVYDYDYYGQTITEIILNGRGVCASYAKTTQYLLQKLGFEIVTIFGYGNSNSHLWNMLKVEGDYYLLDTTWGDPITESDADQHITYEYFLVTTDYMAQDHVVDDIIPLPYCSATACNYYIREGLYFEAVERDRILARMRKDVSAKQNTTFMFSNQAAYDEFLAIVSDGNLIYPMLAELADPSISTERCSYSYDPDHLRITVIYSFL